MKTPQRTHSAWTAVSSAFIFGLVLAVCAHQNQVEGFPTERGTPFQQNVTPQAQEPLAVPTLPTTPVSSLQLPGTAAMIGGPSSKASSIRNGNGRDVDAPHNQYHASAGNGVVGNAAAPRAASVLPASTPRVAGKEELKSTAAAPVPLHIVAPPHPATIAGGTMPPAASPTAATSTTTAATLAAIATGGGSIVSAHRAARADGSSNPDSTFSCTVTSTGDSGDDEGTLRRCINKANAEVCVDEVAGTTCIPAMILFDLDPEATLGNDGVSTIKVMSVLPAIKVPLKIAGQRSRRAGNAIVAVVLDGSLVGGETAGRETAGLRLAGNGIEISGLAVVGFPKHGIEITGERAKIKGNVFVGVTPDGKEVGNGRAGIRLTKTAADAIIDGGATAGTSNGTTPDSSRPAIVVGGNRKDGIECDAARLAIRGSVFIGVTPAGKKVGNGGNGIWLLGAATDAIIDGGAPASASNGTTPDSSRSAIVVGGNGIDGIQCSAARLVIRGSVFIGVTSEGNKVGNGGNGIRLEVAAVDAIIDGGATASTSNGTNPDSSRSAIVVGGNGIDGIYCRAARLVIRGSVFVGVTPEGNEVGNKRVGILLTSAAVDAIIDGGATASTSIGTVPDNSRSAIVVGGNGHDGIHCWPRLVIRGSVFIGVTPAGNKVGNKRNGIWLGSAAVDAIIDGGATASASNGTVPDSSRSAIVVGGNENDGIQCQAARLVIRGSVFIGVTPAGSEVGNKRNGIALLSTAVDAIIDGGAPASASNGTAPDSSRSAIVVGGNGDDGIECSAARLVIRGSVFIGVTPDGNQVGNKGIGIYLTTAAENAHIGSIPTLATQIANHVTAPSQTVHIACNADHGIRCKAAGLVVTNTWIGLAPQQSSTAPAAAQTTTTTTTAVTPTPTLPAAPQSFPSFGNGGDGIHLDSGAADARIGAAPFNECTSPNGYVMCTTASCCEDAKLRFVDKTLDFIKTLDIFSKRECERAARYLQLQDTTTDIGNYGNLSPFGCYLQSGALYANDAQGADQNEPCGSQWRSEAETCPTAKPTITPIFKCKRKPSDAGNDDDDLGNEADIQLGLFPVRISSNAGAGISSVAPRLAVANTLVGLGLSGEYERDGSFGNNGAAGILLAESASDCRIGVDVEGVQDAGAPPSVPAVYISGNAGSGVQAASPNLRVANAAVGVEASSKQRTGRGASAAPNKGVAGIELLETATGCTVGTLTGNANIKTVIAGNDGDGISASGVSLALRAADVGFNLQGEPVMNKRYGVLVEGTEDGADSAKPATFYSGSKVGASGYCGVRVGVQCTEASSTGGRTVYGLATATAASTDGDSDELNGHLTGACQRCHWVVIDCSSTATDDKERPPPNFGRDFFSSMPTNTVSLLMPSAKVSWIDWE
eukprot:gene8481-21772_t